MIKLLPEVCAIAAEAGRLIEALRRGDLETAEKDDRSLVTRADRQADAFLKAELTALLPAGWLSEETADDHARLGHRRLWIVDPLDGTREFVEGVPEYSIAIALVEDGCPSLGVVHNPATGETFSAARGAGAFRNDQPIQVQERDVMLASRSEARGGEFAPFGDWNLVPVGSIQLKLALVAAGAGAVTVSRGPKWEWDVCAGALIVAEAGGIATDVLGRPLRYNQPFPKVRGVLAGAPAAHDRVRRTVAVVGVSGRMDELDRPPADRRR